MWYLVLSESLPDQKENKQRYLPEHRKWLEDQHRAGRGSLLRADIGSLAWNLRNLGVQPGRSKKNRRRRSGPC